jgi:hypothetical protein
LILKKYKGGKEKMKRKIVGIGVMTLLIAAAVLPVVGTMNETEYGDIFSVNSPGIEWEFIVGGPYRDMINCVYETEDGEFIATGVTENPESVYSGWVIKLDKSGNEEWRTIETEIQGQDIYTFGITSIYQTHDGGYIVIGACDRIEDLQYAFLWKLDADGETEWFNSAYSGQHMGRWYVITPWDVFPVVNGYIVAGDAWYAYEDYLKDVDGFLMKTDLNGDVVWRQIYPYGEYHDDVHAICSTVDGGYLLVGTVNMKIYGVPSPEDSDIWLIKTDAEGNTEWEKTYGGPSDEWCLSKDFCQTSDGGFIANSMTSSYNVISSSRWNVWLQKLDKDGNELWNKTYGERKQGDSSWGMDTTSDGGFVFAAAKNHNGLMSPRDSIWLVKTDENGNVEWSETYGGDKTERGYHVQQTSDDGYIVAGATESYSVEGGWDGVILKYSAFNNNRPDKPSKPSGPARGKPDTEYTFTCSASDPDGDSLRYMWDWGDGSFSDWLDTNTASHTWTTEDNFEIKVMAKDSNGGESGWSDPLSFSTPKTKHFSIPFLRFLENHPRMFPILRHLLEL